MKKLTIIALLLVVFTACEKADIRPRTGCMEPTPEAKNLSPETPAPDGTGNPNALGGGPGPGSDNPNGDPNNPDPNGGDITDPLRKKDQKDNK